MVGLRGWRVLWVLPLLLVLAPGMGFAQIEQPAPEDQRGVVPYLIEEMLEDSADCLLPKFRDSWRNSCSFEIVIEGESEPLGDTVAQLRSQLQISLERQLRFVVQSDPRVEEMLQELGSEPEVDEQLVQDIPDGGLFLVELQVAAADDHGMDLSHISMQISFLDLGEAQVVWSYDQELYFPEPRFWQDWWQKSRVARQSETEIEFHSDLLASLRFYKKQLAPADFNNLRAAESMLWKTRLRYSKNSVDSFVAELSSQLAIAQDYQSVQLLLFSLHNFRASQPQLNDHYQRQVLAIQFAIQERAQVLAAHAVTQFLEHWPARLAAASDGAALQSLERVLSRFVGDVRPLLATNSDSQFNRARRGLERERMQRRMSWGPVWLSTLWQPALAVAFLLAALLWWRPRLQSAQWDRSS